MQTPLEKARPLAEKIVAELSPYCAKIEIAGSIRRGRSFVGDIDIVALPSGPTGMDGLLWRAGQKSRWIKGGEQYQVYELANGVQLDLWIAHDDLPPQCDMFGTEELPAVPCNYGMLLLSRTGSVQHNLYMCAQASWQGLHFSPHVGITRAGEVIASRTEQEIFAALKMDFIPPERREK